MTRKPLGKGTYGPKGSSVRIWTDGDLVRAEWRDRGVRRTKSWPNTAENRTYVKTWAKEFTTARLRPALPERVTTRELWRRYMEAEESALRPKSRKIYEHGWKAWEIFVAPTSVAEDLGMLTVAEFRADRTKHGWAIGTTRKAIDVVKIVYAWGHRAKILSRNEVRDYRFKVAKEDRVDSPPEYSRDEYHRLLAVLPFDRASTWRARAVIELLGLQGARQNAVLHLRKEDLDLDAGVVTWRAEWDKVGDEWQQPLRPRAVEVLRAVLAWHERLGLDTRWVFPAGLKDSTSPVYTAQSLNWSLRRAEVAADIPHVKGRAGHGLRRMVFGDVLAATGSIADAMNAINDRDLRVAGRYNKRRLEQMRGAFAKIDRTGDATATAPDLESEAGGVTGGAE